MLTFWYLVNHPLFSVLLWLNLLYWPINLWKSFAARKQKSTPRIAYYDQLSKGNFFLILSGVIQYGVVRTAITSGSQASGSSQSGAPLFFLIGLWYLLTAVRRRKSEEAKVAQERPDSTIT